ncbi:peptidase [Streptomyces sp. NPDC002730]|uniref:peptidase n=1 Tax=Streptomyces sp. NPDC002730 TaxID=3364662 RepID=UPI0036B38913
MSGLAPVGVPSAAAAEAEPEFFGIRLLEVPVARRADPRARTYIVDHLHPGVTIQRRIEISNKSSVPRHIDLYAAAASIANNGFTFAPKRTANELTQWTRAKPGMVNLRPHSVAKAEITINVPRTAQAGERYAVVWAESSAAADATHNVGSIHRVGVRIYLDVGPGGEPVSDFKIEKMRGARDKKGRPSVTAAVRNLGRRAVDLSGTLDLRDGPGGISAGPFRVPSGTTLPPHGTGTVTVPLEPRLPDGPWKAKVRLRSGTVERKATATVTLSKEATSRALLYAGIGAAVLVVIGLVLAGLRRRRRTC